MMLTKGGISKVVLINVLLPRSDEEQWLTMSGPAPTTIHTMRHRLAARVSYLLETMIRYSRIKNIWSHNSFTLTLEQVNLTLMKVMKTGGDMMVKI